MTEENTPDFPYVQYDKETFDKIMSVYGDNIGGFAQNVSQVIGEEYDDPNYVTYSGLRDGTAPIFELFPTLKDKSPAERSLNNEEIIKMFAYDSEGNPIEGGSFLEGLKRDIIPQAASVPTFMGGYALGQTLVAGVPPVSPPTAAIRFGTPIVTGVLGSIGGYFVGEQIADELLGEEVPMLPGQTAAYEAGKTAAGAAAWLPFPFLLPKQLNFGVEAAKAALGGKKTLSSRTAELLEKSVGQMGTLARTSPLSFGIAETVAGTGATAGAFVAEENYPGETLPRLLGEFGGGISFPIAADLLTTRLKMAFEGGRGLYRAARQGKIKESLENLKGGRQEAAINYILESLEEAGEDADEVIRRLSSNELSDILVDDAGKPIELTAALKSGSPTLLTLEKSIEGLTTGVGKERASANVSATRALRNAILALYANPNNKEAIQQGSVLMQAVFEANMEKELASSWKRVFDTFEKIGTDQRQAQLGNNLIGVLENRLSAARRNEKRLWNSVDKSFSINEFIDEDGNITDTPQFISWMENNLPETEEALDDIFPDIAPLINFMKRKKKELGLAPSDGGDGSVPTISPELKKAEDAFTAASDQFRGTSDERILARLTERVAEIDDIDERLRLIRGEAENLRERARGREFEDNRAARKLATAMDRLANLEIVRSRQTTPDVSDAAEEFQPLTAQEIYDMYSTALAKGKVADAKGNNNSARLAYGFARALMRDLENFDSNDAAYNTARAYTKALNDAFTRSFAGDVLKASPTGGYKTAPELVGNDIFQSDGGYLRLKQLDQIGQFELTQALTNLSVSSNNPDLSKTLDRAIKYSINEETGLVDTSRLNKWLKNNRKGLSKYPDVLKNVEKAVETTTSIRGTTEQILRNIRSQAYNPDTGEINIVSLRKWMEKPENQDVLSAMPALKADLEDSITARNLLDEELADKREKTKELKEFVSFMDLLPGTTENPTTAASKALSNQQRKPVAAWNELFRVVDKAPAKWTTADGVVHTKKEAMAGLRSAFIDAAMVKAGGSSNTFRSRDFYDTLFAPHRNSQNNVSLVDWMKSKDLMTEQEITRLKTYASELVKMETFVASGDMSFDDLAETVGPMMDFYLRIAGSSVGSRLQSMIPGDTGSGQLVAAGAGSKAFRTVYSKIFSEIPESLKMDVMTEMFKDPDFLATMLSKGKTQKQKQNIAKRLAGFLSEKGFYAVTNTGRRGFPAITREAEEKIVDEEPVLIPNDQGASLNIPAQAPTLPVGPAPCPVIQTASASLPQTTPQSGPVNRARYAAMFPNDPASALIRQGIGSMMG